MGIASYGDTGVLNYDRVETAISEFKDTYQKDNSQIYNDLHKFYTGCKSTKRDGAALDVYNNNLIYNKSNIIEEKKNTPVSEKTDVCFSNEVTRKSCEFVNSVNSGPTDRDLKFTHDVNYVPKFTPELKILADCDTENTEKEVLTKKNNNGNGSCHDANIKESVNDEPGEYTLEMKRLLKKDKDKLLDTMKVHFEGLTDEKLTAGNIEQFGRFVHDKYDEYSIHDVMVDAKNKFNPEVTS